MKNLYTADHVEISLDPHANILYCRWFGQQETGKIMDAGMKILELVKENGVSRVLNDNREVIGPWQEAAKWAAEIWFPEMLNAGLKHFAWILSVNVFAEISATVAMEGTPAVRTFYTYPEAHYWLLAQR